MSSLVIAVVAVAIVTRISVAMVMSLETVVPNYLKLLTSSSLNSVREDIYFAAANDIFSTGVIPHTFKLSVSW